MRCRFPVILTHLLLLAGAQSETLPLQPYQPDKHTLHLWHLDETGPPFKDSGPSPTPLLGLLNGALPGQPSIPNLDSSVSFNHHVGGEPGSVNLKGAILLAMPSLEGTARDNAPPSLKYFGKDGSFTYEALVKLDILPSESGGAAFTVISMDDEGANRIFSLRIEPRGIVAFIPLIDSGAKGGALASIPTTGPHAINTDDWFHLAATYNGIEDLSDNVRIYWTNVTAPVGEANRIGSGTLTADFSGRRGDFAIGNEARQAASENAESEPFPGCIDEVRISSIARDPRDFIFIPPSERIPSRALPDPGTPTPDSNELPLLLANVLVDGVEADFESRNELVLDPGLHQLDFDFTYPFGPKSKPIQFRCQLEGVDQSWRESTRGMVMICQVRDGKNEIISEAKFDAVGTSSGWESSPTEPTLTHRSEPFFIPVGGRRIYIEIKSGSPDTTGTLVIDNLDISLPGEGGIPLWRNGSFGRIKESEDGRRAFAHWSRRGNDWSMAQISRRGEGFALTIEDGDKERFGGWASLQVFDPVIYGGRTAIISWDEAYNVIGGSLQRATYVNVPPGKYNFRAIALVGGASPTTASLSLPILIRRPIWERPWFFSAAAALSVAVIALYFIRAARRRARRRLRELAFQNALEQDRTRIARDMHDDLGTRITVLNLSASLAMRELDQNPEKSRGHLGKLNQSARDLVIAMDDLVWAVDPAHDSLDQLASHLTRLAEEIFRDSPTRCRLDIPSLLPQRALRSDFRHQLSLAVKEALHNVLRHAGAREVRLSLKYEGDRLTIEIRDDGKGFDPDSRTSRHGLAYLSKRLEEIGGSCTITSSHDGGTQVVFDCPLPAHPG